MNHNNIMEKYNITIFNQSRVLLCLFLFPIFLLLTIFIGTEIKSFLVAVLFLTIICSLMYYFMVGNLTVLFKGDDELVFDWKKKYFFNYKPISSIKISNIKTIVLDNDEFLRKIKTDNYTIHINNSKINPLDSDKLISRLKKDLLKYDIRFIDSWDELAEKGFIKIAYIINSGFLVLSIIIIVILTILKGFKPVSLSILLLIIPQLFLYNKQMKNKIGDK